MKMDRNDDFGSLHEELEDLTFSDKYWLEGGGH